MAIELNRNGSAKPFFLDKVDDNLSYGSFNSLSSIDTSKTVFVYSVDQLHDLDNALFDWLFLSASKVKTSSAVTKDTVSRKRPRCDQNIPPTKSVNHSKQIMKSLLF